MPASIFLSYASEDRAPARSIGDTLSKLGLEVWLDESALGGGDAWDQKIRKQIRECDYFMPIVSARTEARHEGYFRREWRLAVERTLDMADDHPFLLPVVIDDTDQMHARVPEKFLTVQWLRIPDGQATPALEALCRRILSGDAPPPQSEKPLPVSPAGSGKRKRSRSIPYPPFPHEEPGQRVRFWALLLGWLGRSAWISLQRLPLWMRIIVYLWVVALVADRGCTRESTDHADISQRDADKLKTITEGYRGSLHPGDVARLGMQIAKEFSDTEPAAQPAVLAIPFAAPTADPSAGKLADAAFAQAYGRLAVSHAGRVGLDKDSSASSDASAALDRARASHSAYVLYGAVKPEGAAEVLTVTITKVADGSVAWTQSYPVSSADPIKIATDIDAKVPSPSSDSD